MGMKKNIIGWSIGLIFVLSGMASGWPVPDSGQTKCYNSTVEIPCPQPGEPFYGQDGNYLINPPSFTKLDAGGNDLPDDATEWVMVRDNVIGLIWEMKNNMDGSQDYSNPHDADNHYTWYDSNPETNGGYAGTPGDGTDTEDFIYALNGAKFGSFSAWRVPTIDELFSIVDRCRLNPAINTAYFPNTITDFEEMYFSSNTINNNNQAYGVWYSEGELGYPHKFQSSHVRAVRGEKVQIRFIDNSDGTVTDTSTGLMWQQATAPGTSTWEQALLYCENLTFAGYPDWRLPTIAELESIYDVSSLTPAINTAYFPDTLASLYWSSTTIAEHSNWAWCVTPSGFSHNQYKSSYSYVRAVRGGQSQLSGNLVTSAPGQADRWIIGDQRMITWGTAGIEENVKISLSRQGGKPETFTEVIAESTSNNGSYIWTITGPESFNCALRIEPLNDTDHGTTQSLFSIATLKYAWINAEKENDPGNYRLTFNSLFTDGIWPLQVTFTSSDPTIATISGNSLNALENGYVEVSASYEGSSYTKGLFVHTTTDAAEIESNNTKATANTLNEGRFYQGKVLTGDTDWFKFTLPTAALLNIGFLSYSTSADVQVSVYSASDALMAAATSASGNYLNFPLGLPGGTYYLKLSPAGDIDQDKLYVVTFKVLGSLPSKGPVPLNLGETKSGTINNLADHTDFTFSLSQDQGLKMIFTPSGDAAKYRVSLLDSGNSVADQVDCLNYHPVSLEAVYAAGNYTLRITPIDMVDAGSPFTVELTASTQQVEKEHNNSALTASPFDTTQSIAGRLSTSTDVDFYSFDLNAPRLLALAFSCPGSGKNFYLTIYKESEASPIDGITVLNGQATALHMGLGIGRYFVKVAANGVNVETVQQYKMTMTDSNQTNLEIESNNTLRFANAIDTSTSRKGRIYSQADKDYYGFYLTEEGFFTIHFAPSTTTGDYRVSVVDENGLTLEAYTSTNGQTVSAELYNVPRNFYIKIDPNGNIDEFKTYELSLSSTRQIVGLKQLVSVNVSGTKQLMITNETQTLIATASYSDATATVVPSPLWSSLNDAVATVDAGGLVRAVADGSTSIVVSYGGLTGKFDVVVGTSQTVSQHYGNLILVAGGGAEIDNTLKESTQYLSDLVYLRFRNRLFTDKDIYYFNPVTWHDLDGDGYDNNIVDDDSPTVAEFGQAITQWASGKSTDGPLYIYMIDHGGIDTFKIFPNEIVTSAQLKGFINTFQSATGRQVVVMIEACKSGSFTDDLAVQGQDRIVVTCTGEDNAYLDLDGSVSFTQFFVDRLLTGDSIYQGYLTAKSMLGDMGLPYSFMTPRLAEGIAFASAETVLGGNFGIASLFPEFTDQSPSRPIRANTIQEFYAVLSDLEGIEAVWAVVVPPYYIPPSTTPNFETPQVGLPKFTLTSPNKDGHYAGTYSDFQYNGVYRITFYARNTNGNMTVSPATIITVSGGQDSDADTDGDGMTDVWENAHGLNPIVNDANKDPDRDGLTNLQEYQKETNPKLSDTDNDGMPDGWEVNYNLNPLVNDASKDADKDGFSNLREYKLGTDPLNPNSKPEPKAMPWLPLLLDD